MERYDLNAIPKANTAEAGALRVANSVDEKDCGCIDAAITPSNLYNVLNCRKANTAYKGNEIVACPYHTEFLLKCVQAGTTSTGSLDTTSATLGKVYTDGGVKWEVIKNFNGNDISTQAQAEAGTDNTTVMTPLGVKYRLDKDRQIKTYTSFESIGLTSDCTLQGIAYALPEYSVLTCYINASVSAKLGLPANYGFLVAKKTTSSCIFQFEIALTTVRIFHCVYFLSSKILTRWRDLLLSNVGEIVCSASGVIPTGCIACNGAEVSRETYADLFAVIGTKYGAGDGSTTFNVPNLNNGSFIEGSTTTNAGVVKEAGLPNITGHITAYTFEIETAGAFTSTNSGSVRREDGDSKYARYFFKASDSSAVYGKSDTVQPKSVTMTFYIRYS